MDPNQALIELRELVELQNNGSPGGPARSARFAELFEGLDEWMTRGGALPQDWATVSRPSARISWECGPDEVGS